MRDINIHAFMNAYIHTYTHREREREREYCLDGRDEGRLFRVCKTFSTSPSLASDFTSPGTESNTQSCSASRKKMKATQM